LYEIRYKNVLIGTTEFEGVDPSMGFVVGYVKTNEEYNEFRHLFLHEQSVANSDFTFFECDSGDELLCHTGFLQDFSDNLDEPAIQIHAGVESSEEFVRHFSHRSETYEKREPDQE
jgi:hypothetical protein